MRRRRAVRISAFSVCCSVCAVRRPPRSFRASPNAAPRRRVIRTPGSGCPWTVLTPSSRCRNSFAADLMELVKRNSETSSWTAVRLGGFRGHGIFARLGRVERLHRGALEREARRQQDHHQNCQKPFHEAVYSRFLLKNMDKNIHPKIIFQVFFDLFPDFWKNKDVFLESKCLCVKSV